MDNVGTMLGEQLGDGWSGDGHAGNRGPEAAPKAETQQATEAGLDHRRRAWRVSIGGTSASASPLRVCTPSPLRLRLTAAHRPRAESSSSERLGIVFGYAFCDGFAVTGKVQETEDAVVAQVLVSAVEDNLGGHRGSGGRNRSPG